MDNHNISYNKNNYNDKNNIDGNENKNVKLNYNNCGNNGKNNDDKSIFQKILDNLVDPEFQLEKELNKLTIENRKIDIDLDNLQKKLLFMLIFQIIFFY